jgi:hypothetical protein
MDEEAGRDVGRRVVADPDRLDAHDRTIPLDWRPTGDGQPLRSKPPHFFEATSKVILQVTR